MHNFLFCITCFVLFGSYLILAGVMTQPSFWMALGNPGQTRNLHRIAWVAFVIMLVSGWWFGHAYAVLP